ncbi:hypothetical protein I7I51_03142 [Histoplasma capsulatum]|uniref:Uncharacterized protein n=1 Tax=Ajellomyces capsulatus TaxID=5037 RepID=A0A8A1MNY3_AJECA|nr:hypothetical protein I7I51_03142 [Histoplasma capsulatum]
MPQAQFSVDSAVRRLREFSELTEHRMGLKPREARRVHAAFQLLATGPPSDSKRTAQSIDYFEFLQRVKTLTGNDGIVLCAAGLGPSAIVNMKDAVRVYLPSKLKQEWAGFKIGVLQALAKNYAEGTKQVYGGVDPGSRMLPPIEPQITASK